MTSIVWPDMLVTTSPGLAIGALRLAVGHVLDQPADADDVDLGVARGERVQRTGHRPGTAHVPLHVFHPRWRLQGNAAGIEGHALADEDHGHRVAAAVPPHDENLRLAVGPLADAEQRAHAEPGHLGLAKRLDRKPRRGSGSGAFDETFGVDDVRRFGDKVAGQEDPGGNRSEVAVRAIVGTDDGHRFERRLLRRLHRRPVLVEAVGAQRRPVRQPRRRRSDWQGQPREPGQVNRNALLAAGDQLRRDGRADLLEHRRIGLGDRPQSGHENARRRRIGRGEDFDEARSIAVEPRGGDRPRDLAAGQRVEGQRGTGEGSVLRRDDGECVGNGGRNGRDIVDEHKISFLIAWFLPPTPHPTQTARCLASAAPPP
jgi:hypothetical protein